MMTLLVPAALFFALLALPILVLYMLKLRRREAPVSSILLWERLLRDRQANAPWQRIRRNLLLFLQLLILAALVFALARPALLVPSPFSGSVVVILDASASMNAVDVEPTRFEAARRMVADLIRELPSGARMTLILAGTQAEILAANASDPAGLQEALEQAKVSQGASDWQAAFALAASAATSIAGEFESPPAIVLVSDGGLPDEGLPGLPGQVRYLPVGARGDNLAVSALALRSSSRGSQLFARVSNYGHETRSAILSLYADGELFDARELNLPSGEDASVTVTAIPEEVQDFSARLSPSAGQTNSLDILPLDDIAWTLSQSGGIRRVLLAGSGNLFLEQLLAAMPGLEAFRILPSPDGVLELPESDQGGQPYDLYMFNGILPDEIPDGELFLINPPAGQNPLITVGTTFTSTAPARVTSHSLTRFLDWENVNILRAREVVLPEWGEILVDSPGGPLVLVGENGGRRVAVLTFDLHESDLPLQIAFPVLLANLIEYLLREPNLQGLAAGESLQPGESLEIPAFGEAGSLTVTTPSGRQIEVDASAGSAVFTETREVGIYRVSSPQEPQFSTAFAVNLFTEEESDLAPEGDVQIGNARVTASAQEEIGQRELWPLIAAAGLALLMLEWWVYHRGKPTLPRLRRPNSPLNKIKYRYH